ncbi:MAG: site-specific integrase [Bacillus sp. (in: Bacteria)]|nr:site-specific integrase [Bacillus sp. (in: firmicutes)]
MPRFKKQHLKKRADGRYAAYYKRKVFYGKTEEEALSLRDEYKRSELTGEQYNKSITVYEYAMKWLKITHQQSANKTYRNIATHIQHIVNRIGEVPVSEVRSSQIKETYTSEYRNVSKGYLQSAKACFIAVFDAAVADRIITQNPARQKSAEPHKGKVGGHRAITEQEREWINTYCHDHRAYPAIITMLYAGLRPQEAKAMTIEKAFDKENGVLHITESAHVINANHYEITNQGKTKNAIRDVPLLPPVQEALDGKTGFLVKSASGKQISISGWKSIYYSYKYCMETAINGYKKRFYGKTKEHKKILADGGKLPEWIEFNVTPYDLRHSFCTMCRDNGVELHTCVEWMGHADATMILKIYDEVSFDRSKSEAEKLKKRLFNSQNDSQKKTETSQTVDNIGPLE